MLKTMLSCNKLYIKSLPNRAVYLHDLTGFEVKQV